MARGTRDKIVRGAQQMFMRHGFHGTSVEQIAKQAEVSKATLYAHFSTKESLFEEAVREALSRESQTVLDDPSLAELPIEQALRRVVNQILDFVYSPAAIALFRTGVAEAVHFPIVGKALFESGPSLGAQHLGTFLARRVAAGELAIPDTKLAAHQLIEMCKGELFYRRVLGLDSKVPAAKRKRVVNAAIRMFIRAYAP